MTLSSWEKTQYDIICEFLKEQMEEAPTGHEAGDIRRLLLANTKRESILFKALLPLATDYFAQDDYRFVSYWEMVNRILAQVGKPLLPIANRTYEDLTKEFGRVGYYEIIQEGSEKPRELPFTDPEKADE